MMARPIALVTGGSRGIGAATAVALAARGWDVAITYRNKAARAEEVRRALVGLGARALAFGCDLTIPADVERLIGALCEWSDGLDALVLNASGGLERDLVAADPEYPRRINHDAQLELIDAALPAMRPGCMIVFVTSHWAHLYGRVEQLPDYEPVAESKHTGEIAIRARQAELAGRGIRLVVVTGDLVEGTITPRLLERASKGMMQRRAAVAGRLPMAQDMGVAIADAILDSRLATGATVVVGGSLESIR